MKRPNSLAEMGKKLRPFSQPDKFIVTDGDPFFYGFKARNVVRGIWRREVSILDANIPI